MKKIIVDVRNLLGDSLYALRAIDALLDSSDRELIGLVVGTGFAGQLFKPYTKHCVVDTTIEAVALRLSDNCFPFDLVKLDADQAARWCFSHNPVKHIAEGYAHILDVAIPSIVPSTHWMSGLVDSYAHVGIAPFSRSCASHDGLPATKTLDDWKWRFIVDYLKKQRLPLRVYCAPDECLKGVKIKEDEYFYPSQLQDFERSMRACKLLISVDNGLAHLASCFNTPTVVLWPATLPVDFIAPCWSATTRLILMREPPANILPATIMFGVRVLTQELLYGRKWSGK